MKASLRTRSCRCTREDERKHRLIARRLSPACAQTLSIVVDRGSDQVRAHTAFRVCWHAQLLNCLVRRTGDLSPRTRNASKPSSRRRASRGLASSSVRSAAGRLRARQRWARIAEARTGSPAHLHRQRALAPTRPASGADPRPPRRPRPLAVAPLAAQRPCSHGARGAQRPTGSAAS